MTEYNDTNIENEDQLTVACVEYHDNTYPDDILELFHVPNGGKRNKREANKFRRMGVRKGIPDLILIHPHTGIELKFGKNKLSNEQLDVKYCWTRRNIPVYLIQSLEEFKQLMKKLKG